MLARRFCAIAFFLAATLAFATAALADSFQRLPAQVVSVVDCVPSADVVVGDAEYPGTVRAYRWSPAGGLVIVGTRGEESRASAISANGTTVVGSFLKDGRTSAFLWRRATGCVDIGGLGGDFAKASDVSGGGNVVVGVATDARGARRAFRATFAQALAGDLQNLGTLGGANSEALLVSRDGQVVVGRSQVAGGDWHLFVWTNLEGMIDLGSLGGDAIVPRDVSDDGRIVVGQAQNAAGTFVPFLARRATGVARIPNVGDVPGSAELVTGDGRFVFGQARLAGLPSRKAFRFQVGAEEVWPLGTLLASRSSFVSAADEKGLVVGGSAVRSNGRIDAFLRAPRMEGGDPALADRVLNKVFENDALPQLRFVDVACISANGRALVAKARVKGSARSAFVYAEIDRYPAVIDENYFATRPYHDEIAQYVSLTSTYTGYIYSYYGPIAAVYYAHVLAQYAEAYQAICAAIVLDGVDDAAARSLYLECRSYATSLSYYAFAYAYYDIYLATGGDVVYSGEAAYYAYNAYYYQQLDLDELTASP